MFIKRVSIFFLLVGTFRRLRHRDATMSRMRNNIFVAVALALAVFLVGCSKGNKLIGDWSATVPGFGPATITYKEGGTMTITADTPRLPGSKMILSGPWKQEGDKLHMTMTDVDFTNLPAALKGHEKEVKDAAKAQMGEVLNKEQTVTVKMEGDDSFTATGDKGSSTAFTRVKK